MEQVNANTAVYAEQLTPYIDCLVHLDTQDFNVVYTWRLEQEHAMLADRGVGMSDDEVREFVDGYVPAYELYLDGLRRGVWSRDGVKGRQLRIVLGREREVVSTEVL